MNLIPGNVLFLVILGLVCPSHSLPMTPENELRELDHQLGHQMGHQQPRMAKSEVESEFVGRIAPNGEHSVEEDPEHAIALLEELEEAGVKSTDDRPLHILSYNELLRLLALWHLNQNRNVYEANGPDKQPDQAIDAHSV
ncbi:uncharacterized protein LOC128260973 [Drosophila gunungcola]|uniref:Uncharacterized protein n=1 Tax=Drosophila gunungcola TaxID=103775 RepID=A0A9Q0BJT4_9MUSC|nr:uncharacterized protein LOC128260973 [Drosophila gunungcola]KAI8035117.1 hypothetical protein M5D96_012062 [Drosophila gunungcola]